MRHAQGSADGALAARRRRQVGAGDAYAAAPTTSRGAAVEANSGCGQEGRCAGAVEGVESGWHVSCLVLFILVLLRLRIFAGAERGSRPLQMHLNRHCVRVRATKHAPRGPFRLLEHRRGLAKIVERGAVVLAERPRASGSRVLQIRLNFSGKRMRAAKHAPRGPFHLLVRRHGLAEIVERSAGVLVERPRVNAPTTPRVVDDTSSAPGAPGDTTRRPSP